MTDQQKLDALVADLAKDMQPAVELIEAEKNPTTRNNYGRYMNLILTVSKGDKAVAKVVWLALFKAGANPQGIADAFRVTFGRR